MNLHFINYHHNGDIHYSKRFMLDLYNIIQPENCYLHHNNSPRLISDMPFIKNSPPILASEIPSLKLVPPSLLHGPTVYQNFTMGDDIYIVTWLAYFYYIENPIPSDKHSSIYSNYLGFTRVYEELGIKSELKELEYYIPQVNYDYFEKSNIDNFYMRDSNKKVFISNGKTLSGQVPNFSFDPIVQNLANDFPNTTFIVSHPTTVTNSNVITTSNIIKIGGCDLNEISYLSLRCDVLVGRASGPICYAHVKENYFDKNKVMIGICDKEYEAFWYMPTNGCKLDWTDNYTPENVYGIIKKYL